MKRSNKRMIPVVITLLLVITVGFAILTSNLNINGSAKINGMNWDVHFENIQINTEKSTITATSTPTITSDKTTVNYGVTFNKPGDKFVFTVDVVNKGSIDAMIDEVLKTTLSDFENFMLSYNVRYIDSTSDYKEAPIRKYDLLEAGEVLTIEVSVEVKEDISKNYLPNFESNSELEFGLEYVQATDQAEAVMLGAYISYYVENGQLIDQSQIGRKYDMTKAICDDYIAKVDGVEYKNCYNVFEYGEPVEVGSQVSLTPYQYKWYDYGQCTWDEETNVDTCPSSAIRTEIFDFFRYKSYYNPLYQTTDIEVMNVNYVFHYYDDGGVAFFVPNTFTMPRHSIVFEALSYAD